MVYEEFKLEGHLANCSLIKNKKWESQNFRESDFSIMEGPFSKTECLRERACVDRNVSLALKVWRIGREVRVFWIGRVLRCNDWKDFLL